MLPEASFRNERSRRPRHLLVFGFLAPAIAAAAVVVASVMDRSINPIHQSISLLMDGPGQRVLEGGLLASGGCVLIAAWAFYRGVTQGAGLGVWQGLLGAGLMLAGLFMQHHLPTRHQWAVPSPWGPLTRIGLVHVAGATMLYTALVGSCWAVLRRSSTPRLTAALAFGSGLLLAVLLVLFLLTAAIGGPSGLLERLVALVGVLWEYCVISLGWHWA